MKHIELSRIGREETPEGEIFCIFDPKSVRTSPFLILANSNYETRFCFGVRIKGQLYQSDWNPKEAPREKIKDAFKQILFIAKGGWYNTGETMLDDINMFREAKFRCAYCGNETMSPKGACVCRRVEKSLTSR